MRGDAHPAQGTPRKRWGRRRPGTARACGERPPGGLRSAQEIRAQHEAARDFVDEVTAMAPTSHRYTAGQAAALAWLLEAGPAPLTFDLTRADRPSPEAVLRLAERARHLMADGDGLFPQAYIVGVDYVCHWVRGHTDVAPFPVDRPDPTSGRPAARVIPDRESWT